MNCSGFWDIIVRHDNKLDFSKERKRCKRKKSVNPRWSRVFILPLIAITFILIGFQGLPVVNGQVTNKPMDLITQEVTSSRIRRDEHSRGAFGRGIGFFVGEPCHEQCNAILFHIYCNKTTKQCECLSDYPVNVDSRLCVKALRLGELCEYDASCKYYDGNSVCHHDELRCRCKDNHYPKMTDDEGMKCVLSNEMNSRRAMYSFVEDSHHLITVASAAAGLVAFAILICAALRYFTKSRFMDMTDGRPGQFRAPTPALPANGGFPSTAIFEHVAPSIFTSRRSESIRSLSNEYLPPSRRLSYTMLAPPSNFASRRHSSSAASHSSYSSFKSQSSFRNYRPAYGFTLRGPITLPPPESPVQRTSPSPRGHCSPGHARHPLDTSSHPNVYSFSSAQPGPGKVSYGQSKSAERLPSTVTPMTPRRSPLPPDAMCGHHVARSATPGP
ncbi:hypothetical protein HDE_13726 [Halotydeus destructor]|nr:hypothetical protein HDE_13726 [Halotydeus destructor]